MPVQQWEHAVLRVEIVSVSTTEWNWEATAWVADREIYSKNLSTMYWSVPLADLGRRGWELVSASPDNAVISHSIQGWTGSRDASMPIVMVFFFKRPLS